MTNSLKRIFQAIFWVFIYIFLTIAPLFALLVGPTPPGREFWKEFSVALGFAGLSMMGLQFFLTARFKFLKAPYGSDIVYYFHRQISILTFALIIIHPILLFIFDAGYLKLLNIFTSPWRAKFAVIATLALIGLVFLSIYRKRLKTLYEHWRILHGSLAILAMMGGMLHILGVNHYLSVTWKRYFWIVYITFWVGLLVWTRLLKPWLEMRRPYEITSNKAMRGNVNVLTIKPSGHSGIRFLPGQFVWISIRSNPFQDSEHPFSIASSAEESGELSFGIKEFGDFTNTIKDLQPGEKVYLDGPYGSFSIDHHPNASGFVFLAGGIGITPFISTLRTMRDRGDKHPVWLFYANNTWDAVSYREELSTLESAINLHLVHVINDPPDGWTGETGFINKDILNKHLPENMQGYEFFICGPLPMMTATEKNLRILDIHPGDIHTEMFYLV